MPALLERKPRSAPLPRTLPPTLNLRQKKAECPACARADYQPNGETVARFKEGVENEKGYFSAGELIRDCLDS
ncbi:hypothetical protein FACS1894107_15960 [Planctomycetales bacterium]|nr:hypothetical protein FACS1894107_15960 [Planctomycetales bacterium]GHS97948.1 hypothetical protein FACS1894108_05220 [Planctomycetales bacterium]